MIVLKTKIYMVEYKQYGYIGYWLVTETYEDGTTYSYKEFDCNRHISPIRLG